MMVRAGKRFGRYGRESKKKVWKADVMEDALSSLSKAFEGFRGSCVYENGNDEAYAIALGMAGELGYAPLDIERFSMILLQNPPEKRQGERHLGWKAGIFLSALINASEGDGFTVNTGDDCLGVYQLGYRNTKSIRVMGPIGSLGSHMLEGHILVEGAVKAVVGMGMSGGSILVKGDACNVGPDMKGGSITVEGMVENAGIRMRGGIITVRAAFVAGTDMEGGEIRVQESLGFIHYETVKGGKIFLGTEEKIG